MHTTIRRGVVAVATALACLAVLATPASAATLTAVTTGGTVLIENSTGNLSDTLTITPPGTLGTDCSRTAVGVVNNTTTSTTSWQVTSYSTRTRFQLSGAGTWYIFTVTLNSSTAGSVTGVTGASATLEPATVSLSAVVQNTTFQSATDTACTVTTTKCRFLNVALTLQGTYSGNIHTPAVSDTATWTGSGTLGAAFAGCTAPFTGYSGGTGTVTGLTAQITAVT